jgi:molybdopterin/thiamine biosynthesis adenylyltransferase
LVLVGAKNFTLIDFDVVEVSNLSRTVLFNKASMDAMSGNGPHMKVDVMAAGIKNLDSEATVTAIPKGVPDWRSQRHNEDVETGLKSGSLRPLLTDEELMALSDEHDIAIIGTDGISPHAYFNNRCYSRIPQVRGSMNTAGSGSVVSVTIPFVTACLQCHDIQSPLVTRGKDNVLDWNQWSNASGFNCKKMAEESGAASFAHANSVVASAMASQAILLLHGYPYLKGSNLSEWPAFIPPPSWGARIELPTYLPEKTKSTPIPTKLDPDGFPECPACSALYHEDDDFTWERYGFLEVEATPRFNPAKDPFAKKKAPPPKSKRKVPRHITPNNENQPSPSPPPEQGSQNHTTLKPENKPPLPPPPKQSGSIAETPLPPPVTDLPEDIGTVISVPAIDPNTIVPVGPIKMPDGPWGEGPEME